MLRAAAAAKHEAALRRAENGLSQLIKNGEEITFRAVARAGRVSLDFLYAEPGLRSRIEHLRAKRLEARPLTTPPQTAGVEEGNVLRTLRFELGSERARRQAEVRELNAKLAAAHGEILRLRRMLESAGLAT